MEQEKDLFVKAFEQFKENTKTFTDNGGSKVEFRKDNDGMDVLNTNGEKVRELTFGEKLVGLTFNPSGDANVLKAKQLCAELADLVMDNEPNGNGTYLYNLIKGKALGEILNAQMNVVKLLTLKY